MFRVAISQRRKGSRGIEGKTGTSKESKAGPRMRWETAALKPRDTMRAHSQIMSSIFSIEAKIRDFGQEPMKRGCKPWNVASYIAAH